ncbi:MAG: hypothetical protein B6D37_00595 [Sphingobacteriales bacterium UTBCD1]|jgi:hypothetical protein|nr:MAG: hypothetical protein B6D37_00595 [Sphingobacteriales bacterium UTBCD1]
MQLIKNFLERWGIHCFLLPLFFILHTYIQYYGLVSTGITLKIFFIILSVTVAVFFLLLLITRNANKSMQLATLYGFLFLFFGVIKDLISDDLRIHFLSRYIVLLPLLFILAVLLTILILKKRDFRKSNLYENILLLVFIGIDCVKILFTANISFINKNLLVNPDIIQTVRLDTSISKPDVYFLVFDSYPGSEFLKTTMQYNNSSFDSALIQRGFFVEKSTRSNYNRTIFSLSSTLNFQYLNGIKENASASSKEYSLARLSIKYSIVPELFQSSGYTNYNLSIFDFPDHPALYRESFLTLPDQDVLLYNTLQGRIKNDILWNLILWMDRKRYKEIKPVSFDEEFTADKKRQLHFNNTVIDSVVKIPVIKTNKPKFIYAHFYLPHPPFFYNAKGELNDLNYILTDESLTNRNLFLSYLQYTNDQIIRIIDSIQKLSPKPPVIIIQSDHGFRDFKGGTPYSELYFDNYSAFYFPDRNYNMIYDSMTNINTFPVFFNKYFNAKIPLQKDSMVAMPY